MALNQETAIIKKKWKQLRDTFRTELKKIPPERSGDPGPGGLMETLHSGHILRQCFSLEIR
ncbi:uncharacterized protein LOC118742257 isoform X2 [Rhagoletis pomonella]|uniref:uncharacterized protein LOC118742257 isoform X2 n=1 Tax=Rhagoletis pomonella TaxID=28610 RepID=UPI00177BD07D|nr:uncharacterized protein LOC118742257 isoform X2 [Rhagoletis pomonella]